MPAVDHSKNIIEVQNVSFSYGKEEVLKDITLEIHKGDYLGIIGPNGSGKTTLIKIMLGLIQPSRGSVRIFDKDIKDFHDWQKIGYIPQKATHFDIRFPLTVEEAVLMGRYAQRGIFHRLTAEDKKMAKKALEEVGMWANKNRLIGDLSGGQQQRVFIARALAGHPKIIFMDEPTASVDKKTHDEIYNILRLLNGEHHITLIVVSHDIETIAQEAMHVACIDQTLVCHSSPEEFLKDSRSKNIFGENVKFITHHHHKK